MQNIRCQVPAGGILAQHFAEVPSHLFYPGLLLMKITWVQSQMARLLVLSEVAALRRAAIAPAQLWYDRIYVAPVGRAADGSLWFKEHLASIIAQLFRGQLKL